MPLSFAPLRAFVVRTAPGFATRAVGAGGSTDLPATTVRTASRIRDGRVSLRTNPCLRRFPALGTVCPVGAVGIVLP